MIRSRSRRIRANTTARQYGSGHQARRLSVKPFADAGLCDCARCGERIVAGQAWDLDHRDDRRGYLGPSHRFSKDCSAGGNRATSRPRRQSRAW